MDLEDVTLSTDADPAESTRTLTSEQSIIFHDAKRLLDFKRQHITRQNQTPCPECAELVSIQAKKCRHCGSEIAEYTEVARESLEELNHLTDEIYALHARDLQRHAEATRERPLRERVQRLLRNEDVRRASVAFAPPGIALLGVILWARHAASGLVFWTVLLAGGALGLAGLRRSKWRHYMTCDLFHLVLIGALALIATNALVRPKPFWPEFLDATVEVVVPSANLRVEPTTRSAVVETSAHGDRLRVTGREGEWLEVRAESGETGWIHANLVR